MHFPTARDPYFKPTMSALDVYRFGTQHYEHHRRQLKGLADTDLLG